MAGHPLQDDSPVPQGDPHAVKADVQLGSDGAKGLEGQVVWVMHQQKGGHQLVQLLLGLVLLQPAGGSRGAWSAKQCDGARGASHATLQLCLMLLACTPQEYSGASSHGSTAGLSMCEPGQHTSTCNAAEPYTITTQIWLCRSAELMSGHSPPLSAFATTYT